MAKKTIFYIYVLFVTLTVYLSEMMVYGSQPYLENNQTICDMAGRKVTVLKPFGKIISLYGAHTENLFALGLDSEIIGVSENETYPPEVSKKKTFSYHDDPEKFLVAAPDLVLVRPMIDTGYAGLVSRLEKSGIIVLSFQPSTVEEMYTYWEILGVLSGKREKARLLIQDFRETLEHYETLSGNIKNKKKVYFEAIHSRMKTFSPDSMAVFALVAAGGINVADDALSVRGTNIASYGKEKLISKGKDIDVFLAQTGVMNKVTLNMIRTEPGFSAIKAISEGHVYLIDEMIVSRPGSRLLQGIFEIGAILYPDVYTDDVRKGVKTEKKLFYEGGSH